MANAEDRVLGNRSLSRFDFCVVGSGAGGAAAAYVLTAAGKNVLVLEAGGRIYFSKDSRLRADHVPAMYPELERWRAIQGGLDPDGRLRSDMDRRLRLTAGGSR